VRRLARVGGRRRATNGATTCPLPSPLASSVRPAPGQARTGRIALLSILRPPRPLPRPSPQGRTRPCRPDTETYFPRPRRRGSLDQAGFRSCCSIPPLPTCVQKPDLLDHLVGAGGHNLSVTDQPTTISLIWICVRATNDETRRRLRCQQGTGAASERMTKRTDA
jgi:hypothetical protein